MMADFQELQRRFAAHIREPERNPAPAGHEERRLTIYRELFFNNLLGFLSTSFPVLRSLYSEAEWRAIARDFYANHPSHTPYFLEIPEVFLAYLSESGHEYLRRFPFALELAHYEWVELGLSISEAESPSEHDATMESIGESTRLGLSPLAWVLVYRYPVQRIGPDFLPTQASTQPTCLVVYRSRDDAIRFVELGLAAASLLQALDTETGKTLVELANTIDIGMAHETWIQAALPMLRDFHSRGILYVMA